MGRGSGGVGNAGEVKHEMLDFAVNILVSGDRGVTHLDLSLAKKRREDVLVTLKAYLNTTLKIIPNESANIKLQFHYHYLPPLGSVTNNFSKSRSSKVKSLERK